MSASRDSMSPGQARQPSKLKHEDQAEHQSSEDDYPMFDAFESRRRYIQGLNDECKKRVRDGSTTEAKREASKQRLAVCLSPLRR